MHDLRDDVGSTHYNLSSDLIHLFSGSDDSNKNISTPLEHGIEVEMPTYILAWVSLVNSVLFLVGVSGNVMVTVIVARVREMRIPNNFFLVSLSIADLLVLIICQPSALLEFYAKDRWYLGTMMCKVVPFLENTAQRASVLIIATISCERYNAICRPLRAQYLCSRSRTVHIITILWIVSAAVCVPFIGITVLEDATFYDGSLVKVCRTKIYHLWHYAFTIGNLICFYLIPLTFLVLLYAKIMCRLMTDVMDAGKSNDSRELRKLRTRRQIVWTLIAIIVIFFVSLLPARAVVLWVTFAQVEDVANLGMESYYNLLCFARVLIYFNSACNPIVYSLMSTKFRNAFKSLLGCNRLAARQRISHRYFLTTSQPNNYCDLRLPSNNTYPSQFRLSSTRSCECKLHMVSATTPPVSKHNSSELADGKF